MTVCKRVHYSGRVQGVGFRYTAQGLASGYVVAGYVRNLSDGRVELQAEGEADQVEGFLAAVASRMASYVTQTTIEDRLPEGLKGFRIRHGEPGAEAPGGFHRGLTPPARLSSTYSERQPS